MSATKDTLKLFGAFAGLAAEAIPGVVDMFAAEHPELVDESHRNAPPPAPDSSVDHDVRAAIHAGKV